MPVENPGENSVSKNTLLFTKLMIKSQKLLFQDF